MQSQSMKQSIVEAAVYLFNTKGFAGTSIRQIAERANCNVASISYYFENKEGLLEYLVTSYLEGYLSIIEFAYNELDNRSARECLLLVVRNIMLYQREHRQLTRFVLRETTVDTTFIREVMTTYFTKEKYYLQSILDMGYRQQEFKRISIPFVITQLKGMLTMPYLHSQYMVEVLHIMPYDMYVTEHYCREIEKWINDSICMSHSRLDMHENLMKIPVNL